MHASRALWLMTPVALTAVACQTSFSTCEDKHRCTEGDGDGDTGGNGDGDGDTGGNGGSSGPCDACEGDTPACTADEECVECTADDTAACTGESDICDPDSNTCVECVAPSDCIELNASKCDAGTCVECTADTDCERFTDTPVCEEDSGTCVECTTDTEEELCGDFSCSSLTHTCTTTERGIVGTCQSCEADSECSSNRKCVMDQFEGEDVGYFCFFEQAETGCGNTVTERRPYRTIVEATSLDGTEPQNFCLPPNATTCKGIKDTQSVSCTSSDECGLPDLDDGYCPDSGDGAGLCTYTCVGGVECSSGLECTDGPQHCNPE